MEEIVNDRYADVLEWVEKDKLCTLREKKPLLWKMLPVVDLALIFADPLLPNIIPPWTMNLIDQIRDTEYYLSADVNDAAELVLRRHKKIILEGLEISLKIAITKSEGKEKELLVEKLKTLCFGSKFTSALRAVINDLTTGSCFLEVVYNKTNGHWPKVKLLLEQILHLIVGALIAAAVNETCTSENAAESLKAYREQMEEIEKKIQSVCDKCKREFKENMLKDLEEVLDQRVLNDTAVDKLSDLMKEKYDWLVHYCIICDESINLNYCFLGNNYVKCLERNGKFGVIFYRDAVKDEIVDYEKRKKVESVLAELAKNSSTYTTAEDLGQTVMNNCKTKGIEVCACAIMRPKAALQWIPFYGTGAMMAYGTAVGKLQRKGTCVTVCDNLVNDPIRLNPVLDILVLPLVITETIVDHVRGGGVKPRFFAVLYKP